MTRWLVTKHGATALGLTGLVLVCLPAAEAAPQAARAPARTAGPDKTTIRGIKRAFARMTVGVRQENELQFKSGWLPLGYEKTLVGGRAGLAGRGFYRQGKSRRWLLRPKLDKIRTIAGKQGSAYLMPCLIWSPMRRKAVATVYALVIYNKKWRRWQMLGGGGRRADVRALGERYVAGEPLIPRRGR